MRARSVWPRIEDALTRADLRDFRSREADFERLGLAVDPLEHAYRVRLEQGSLTREQRADVRRAFLQRDLCSGRATLAVTATALLAPAVMLALVAGTATGLGSGPAGFALCGVFAGLIWTGLVLSAGDARRVCRDSAATTLVQLLRPAP